MNLESILGKILQLTKNIYLKEPKEKSYKHNYLISYVPLVSFDIWFTQSGIDICREISLMSIQYDSNLKNGNVDDFKDIIEKIFENIIFNEYFFEVESIISSKKTKIFNSINKNLEKREFALKVWHIIKKELSANLKDWVIFYPLPRIKTKSLKFNYDGLSLMDSEDERFWKNIVGRYPALEGWDPVKGKEVQSNNSVFSQYKPETWLICEINGSENISREKAGNLMRKFIGTLLSHLYNKEPGITSHSYQSEISYSMQVSSNINSSFNYSHIGVILHPLLIDIEITNELLNKVSNWYKNQYKSDDFNRASKGAQFVQYGITRKTEVDKFLHYFISLDALFGSDGKVEESIIEGVSDTDTEFNKEKIKRIYKLRSDLVHGGSSYINDWKGIIDYQNHFNSYPLKDVQDIAMKSLVNYFEKQ
ncbi:HEPN domain-containing protein [Halanaerobium praevalens]|uniref:Uncharacterized protein n=1 Tax=Halanaerobium praevalens (strain ATCC 33744 / DSM 2228 / GSL) TaxID=572479 RepID=E3DRT5_HALPG|nr:HEPN domain-containing protein [Halanaerobium praevalens]ADO78149.1 hypothetical protein Hprae_2025 [Halanaerobium praevalens DSM 2228]